MIKILILAAYPLETAQETLDKELKIIEEALNKNQNRDNFAKPIVIPASQSHDLIKHVRDHNPEIIHFVRCTDEAQGLYCLDKNREFTPWHPKLLAQIFSLKNVKSSVRCVILNGCWADNQAQAIHEANGIYLIGTSNQVSTNFSEAFSDGFYQWIDQWEDIEDVYETTCVYASTKVNTLDEVLHCQVLSPPRPKMPKILTPPINVLFLSANPIELPQMRLDIEKRTISERFKTDDADGDFNLTTEWAVEEKELTKLLTSKAYTIIHFAGHGAQGAGIYLLNRKDEAILIDPDAFAGLFTVPMIRNNLECILINACWSIFQAQKLVEIAKIPYVIGMTKVIPDNAAIAFASSFYLGLRLGMSIPDAYHLGCKDMGFVMNNPTFSTVPCLLSSDASQTILPNG
jgi:hypothetical protein